MLAQSPSRGSGRLGTMPSSLPALWWLQALVLPLGGLLIVLFMSYVLPRRDVARELTNEGTLAAAGLLSFYFFALTLRTIPTGVAYAIWSGVGMVLIALLGLIVHHQKLDLPAVAGMALIIAGVAVMQLFSKTLGD